MKKSLLHIFAANIIYLLINIFNSFLLPKFLSVDTYAIIKTYTLYVGYAGFLSLGYADGMYLKYGGKDINELDLVDLSTNYKSYTLFELIVCFICLIIALMLNDFVLICFSIGGFFINIIGYYKNLYQAVGEFKLYGKSLNYQTILLFFMSFILIFCFQSDNPKNYIIVQVLSALIVVIYLTLILNKNIHILGVGKVSLKEIVKNISMGFTLMLGNFSSSIFTSLDRWFIKALMTNKFFAYYSFAVSLENIVDVFITPITISLYNSFCKNYSIQHILKIKKMTLLWGFLIITAAFPVKFIIINFLPQYSNAISIILPLFAAQAFYAVIKGVHINLYKAEHKEKKYFKIMIFMMIVAVILNCVLYFFSKQVESFAYATLITAIVWQIYCEIENSKLRFNNNEYVSIILLFISYFVAGNITNAIMGLLLYLLSFLIIVIIFMRDTLQYCLNSIFLYKT